MAATDAPLPVLQARRIVTDLYAPNPLIYWANFLFSISLEWSAFALAVTQPMDLSEQYLDSVNVPGNRFVTSLWAPVGLRYHATHHLFAAMPYHALGTAHKRLIEELPDSEVYLRTTRSSLWNALARLWADAAAGGGSQAKLAKGDITE